MPDDGGLAGQFERFRAGQMPPEEAAAYRQALKDNPELLDDPTRAIVEQEHLLDTPPEPPPSPTLDPMSSPMADGTPEPEPESLPEPPPYESPADEPPTYEPPPDEATEAAAQAAKEEAIAAQVLEDLDQMPEAGAGTNRPGLEPEPDSPAGRPFPLVVAALAGVAVLALVAVVIVGAIHNSQPTSPAKPSAAIGGSSVGKTPAGPAVPAGPSATVTGVYTGSFTFKDSKCYSMGYLNKYEEDFLMTASDGSIWQLNLVPDLNDVPGFFFARQTAAGKPEDGHIYWGYGSGPQEVVTLTPGQNGVVDHSLFVVGTNDAAGHLKATGTCPAGSPTN